MICQQNTIKNYAQSMFMYPKNGLKMFNFTKDKGIARMTYQRETTDASSDFHQLHTFSKCGLLLKKEFAPGGSNFFP